MKNAKYHAYKNYADAAGSRDKREMHKLLESQPDLKALRYEMTTFCDRVIGDTLYFGCTNFAGDLLLALNLKTGEIRSCGYRAIYEENEYEPAFPK